VLKNLLKPVMMLALLVGCYFGYVHAFDFVVERLKATREAESVLFSVHPSNSKLEAIAVARAGFGPNHWSTDEHQTFRYYNAERGFWMFAKKVDRIVLEDGVKYDGKRLRMEPFALIWKSRDGKDTKTITSDVAVFDLNEPLSLNMNPEGEALKIKHARIERNVLVRDDRGTPDDPKDDMHIGPLTAVEYDEPTQKIESDSDTVIWDPEMRITGQGLEIKLRTSEATPGQSSAGFQGAEYAILRKHVDFKLRDAGKSGLFQSQRTGSAGAPARAQSSSGPGQKSASPATPSEPTPLYITCDGMMRVDLAKPVLPVRVGPPEPSPPTVVRFEQNVVAKRGQLDDEPDQLTCDTLRLTMVPGEKGAPAPAGPQAATSGERGLFGDLTLQRAMATGHAVWLYLPAQGVKVRCNELFHKRQAPFQADQTYFRGDASRPLELWKLDTVRDEDDPDYGKVTAFTYITSIDATLFDGGNGVDASDVVAHGPGRLETRPDRDQPVERIAIWQDTLTVQNEVGPDHRVQRKIIDLTGNRPCFIDKLQETSLDSSFWLRVWLKPRQAPEKATAAIGGGALASSSAALASASGSTSTNRSAAADGTRSVPATLDHSDAGVRSNGNAGSGGGGLRLEKLLAVRDAHLLAPSKTMTARERLDAEFVDAEPLPSGAAAPAEREMAQPESGNASHSPSTSTRETQDQSQGEGKRQEQVAPQDQPEKQDAEPPMVGSADRIWAKVAVQPEGDLNSASGRRTRDRASPKAATGSAGTASRPSGSSAEVREAWMFGSVAVHQDPAEGKTRGQDASGEALYLDNRGRNRALTRIYSRDPSEKSPRPGPLPLARVSTEDRLIKGEVIRVNQETDRVWVDGCGTSTQLTDRGLLSDKSADEGAEPGAASGPTAGGVDRHEGTHSKPAVHETRMQAERNSQRRSTTSPEPAPQAKSQPITRAGRPLSEKVPLTITWTRKMEFEGRSTDADGNRAAKATFHGFVVAEIEDGKLSCTDHMITYTDKEIPLTQLGTLMKPAGSAKEAQPASDDAQSEPRPDLTLIECFGRAVAINRKVDPERPIEIQRQRIEGEYLSYDRRTGNFYVPGKGIVYLYERENKSPESAGSSEPGADGKSASDAPRSGTGRTTTRRSVTPIAGRAPTRAGHTTGAAATRARSTTSASTHGTTRSAQTSTDEIPPLILTQIRFATEMRGRFGTSKGDDTTETRWAEFFGDIQSARAQVDNVLATLNEDRLPSDGFFLTGQVMRVITEPPPPGAPPSTPARNYVKAWEKAAVRNHDTVVNSDVITYDSGKDLIYASAEPGRGVSFAQQHAIGQPAAVGQARALQLNPKTGMLNFIDTERIQLIDRKTGERPARAAPPDPNAKPPKKRPQPFKLPINTLERKGFTGQ
jgi:hypothetical protein